MQAWKTSIEQQFGAAIGTLENVIAACPGALWDDGSEPPELFWYSAYHCLFFLDYYLSESAEGFAPPAPFTLSEADPAGVMPERTYTKDELQAYLEHGRKKCRARIESLTDDDWGNRCGFERPEVTVVELLLYTRRC